jgi:hypothetical protein
MATQPKYRSDIAGNVKNCIADFEHGLRNELANSEEFIFLVEDSSNYEEWKDFLTLAEMRAAFKRAQTTQTKMVSRGLA